jgi:hypothetical protein
MNVFLSRLFLIPLEIYKKNTNTTIFEMQIFTELKLLNPFQTIRNLIEKILERHRKHVFQAKRFIGKKI